MINALGEVLPWWEQTLLNAPSPAHGIDVSEAQLQIYKLSKTLLCFCLRNDKEYADTEQLATN